MDILIRLALVCVVISFSFFAASNVRERVLKLGKNLDPQKKSVLNLTAQSVYMLVVLMGALTALSVLGWVWT